MKTYLLNYLKPNTHTYYRIIKSKDEIETRSLAAKELDLEKRKRMITPEMEKRFIEIQQNIVISPGINEITEEHYLLLKTHPNFDYCFECRPVLMEWISGFGPDDEKLKSFSSIKEQEALKIVDSMWHKPLIEKYLNAEKREKVRAALESQLEKLMIKPKKVA